MVNLSVIAPIYKVEQYIELFARSLFEQSMIDNVEFIFINDCTPDASISILRNVLHEYPNRKKQTRIVEMSSNKGPAAVRRYGIELACGEYILCVDSDDYMDSAMLEEMHSFAKRNEYDVVIADYYLTTSSSVVQRCQKPDSLNGKKCMNRVLEMRMHGAWYNKLIKRSILENHPILYPKSRMDMLEDLMITSQILYYASNVGYLNNAFYYYVQVPTSISHNMSEEKLGSMLYAYDFIKDFFLRNQIDDAYSLNALVYFRISTLSGVALDGYETDLISDYKQYRYLLPLIYKHPRLSFSYKLALTAQILQLKSLVRVLIFIRKILR